ncbi:hypothetical protein [Polyangium aurulentum]|uniref:hypothetical protein n=1 Tax=Polyangium aurulentum TaxID=2567896 RepID=UPI0010AE3CDC|nr:hypothetical protein [Polyangium aurulentum]UQA54658.1 hypothetical protein E8A73_025125 [Polyangium aurulentum]
MTSMTTALPRPADPPRSGAWGDRVGELLVVGGATPILFLFSWLLRSSVPLDAAELAVGFTMFHAAHVINDPHFSVTYLLFYKDARARAFGARWSPAQRLRYLVVGFVAPVLLGAWAVAALVTRSAFTMGLLIQLMFLLVGWHYVKQGFGVFTVLAARRGVRFSPRERLAVLAHCFAGWAYAWASPADPGRELEEKGVVYTSIAHPPGLERITQIVFFATTLPLVLMLVRKWRREGRLPLVAPLTGLLCSIWAWSIYSGVDPLVRYMIPALHSVQYLYFVHLLKGNEAREREGPPWFERSARVRLGILAVSALGLGWLLFHGAPAALDGALVPRGTIPTSGTLGPTPYFAAIYAFVNIHHYLMDTVIWRRDNPETRYLQAPALPEERPAS